MPGKQFGNATVAFQRVATICADAAVWQTGLGVEAAEVLRCAELLSADERERAARYRFERDRRRFIVARGRLRLLLGEYLEMSPAAIAFDYTSRGKPFVHNSAAPIYFNVAHTEDVALYAISTVCPTGVDIEYVQRAIDHEKLAARFFTPGENRALQGFPAAQRKHAFLACWTRKEAVVKAIGDGLSLPLDQFEVTLNSETEPRILGSREQRIDGCTLHAVDVGDDYAAALATFSENSTV